METRHCPQCATDLPLSEFYQRDTFTPSGQPRVYYQAYCRACTTRYAKTWIKLHPDAAAASSKRYRAGWTPERRARVTHDRKMAYRVARANRTPEQQKAERERARAKRIADPAAYEIKKATARDWRKKQLHYIASLEARIRELEGLINVQPE